VSVIARIDNTKQLSIVGNIVEYPSVLESTGRNLLLETKNEQAVDSSSSEAIYEYYFPEGKRIEVGETYTVSYDARSDNGADQHYISIFKPGGGSTAQKIKDVKPSMEYKRYRFTFTYTSSDIPTGVMFVSRAQNWANNTGTTFIKNVKLEKTTPWLEEQINLEGRNLLKKTTSTFQTVNHSQYFADMSGVLNLKDYGLSVGEVLTASVYVKTTSIAGAGIRFRWLNGANSNHANDWGTSLDKNSEGMLVLTSKIPAQTESFQVVINAEDNDTNTGTFEYKLLKLEKGSTATPWNPALEEALPWTPAPEDLDFYGDWGRNLITLSEKHSPAVEITDTGFLIENSYSNIVSYGFSKRLEPNTTYTMSFNVEATGEGGSNIAVVGSMRLHNGVDPTIAFGGSLQNNVVRTFTTGSTVPLYDLFAYGTTGEKVTFSNVKFEKGSIPTPWTPAPEDGVGLIYPDNVQYFSFGFKSNGDLYTNQVIKSPSQFSMKNDGVTNSITVSEIIENAVLS